MIRNDRRMDIFRAKIHFFRHNPYFSFIPAALFFLAEIWIVNLTKLSRKVNSLLLRSYRSPECQWYGLPDFASLMASPKRSAGRWLWFFTEPTLVSSTYFSTPPFWIGVDKITPWEKLWKNPCIIFFKKSTPAVYRGELTAGVRRVITNFFWFGPFTLHKNTTTLY